jgi:hypothetical protein
MRRVAALLATLGVLASSASPATAAARCLDRTQAKLLVHVMLPDVVDALVRRCAAVLPPGEYLARSGDALRKRFPTDIAPEPGTVRALVAAISGRAELPKSLSDAAILGALRQGMSQRFKLDQLPADQCGGISKVLAPLDPLPAENVEEFLLSVFAVVGKRPGNDLMICEAP